MWPRSTVIETSRTASTTRRSRPTTNRFVTCSTSRAGGPTRAQTGTAEGSPAASGPETGVRWRPGRRGIRVIGMVHLLHWRPRHEQSRGPDTSSDVDPRLRHHARVAPKSRGSRSGPTAPSHCWAVTRLASPRDGHRSPEEPGGLDARSGLPRHEELCDRHLLDLLHLQGARTNAGRQDTGATSQVSSAISPADGAARHGSRARRAPPGRAGVRRARRPRRPPGWRSGAVARRPARQDVVDRELHHRGARGRRAGSDVGQDDAVRESKQQIVGRDRLDRGHVEPDSEEAAFCERLPERALVHDRAAGRVHENRRRPHETELAGADQAPRVPAAHPGSGSRRPGIAPARPTRRDGRGRRPEAIDG